MGRRILILMAAVCLWAVQPAYAGEEASEALEEYDFSQLEAFIQDNLSEQQLSFTDLVHRLIFSEESFSLKELGEELVRVFWGQVEENRKQAVQILLLAVCAAVLNSIASVFGSDQISEQAWFAVFLMIAASMLAGFSQSCGLVTKYLDLIILFMKMLLPSFCLSMVCISGAAASSLYYQATFGVIAAVDAVLVYGILPLIKLYFCLALVNGLTGGERFNGFLELLKVLYEWIMKTLCAVIVGLQVIQGLILPMVSRAGPAVLEKLLNAIPGIGNSFRSTAEILMGTGVLIKNGIGMAGCVVLVMIGVYPIIQMAAIVLIYYGIGAIISPIADKRLMVVIQSVSYTNRMLLKALSTAIFLFLITMAIICAFTNQVL